MNEQPLKKQETEARFKAGESARPDSVLALYGLTLRHPVNWVVRFGKVLYHEHGIMDVLEPSDKREAVFTVMWRPSTSLFKYYSPKIQDSRKPVGGGKVVKAAASLVSAGKPALKDEDMPSFEDPDFFDVVANSLEAYRHNVRKGMKTDFSKFRVIDEKAITLNNHFAICEEVEFIIKKGFVIKRGMKVHRSQVYFICPHSDRLVVLHTTTAVDKKEMYSKIFQDIFDSFCCH
ncbi:MAG: DUF1795 domain-containing protein [Desulfobacteraceae bacterium]|nr:DUF1795 domain-containing protein [Desulfobacteraceae bacterium]